MKEIEEKNSEIDKYKSTVKKIKSVIPLVTILVILSLFFFSNANNLMLTLGGIVAVCMYGGSFVLAYYQCTSKIKNLNKELNSRK